MKMKLEHLEKNARFYSFYQLKKLVRLLKEENESAPLSEKNAKKTLFTSSANMGFAATDVQSFVNHADYFELESTFLGLSGSQSPLPNFFLDELAINDDESISKDFLGLFNHRALSILYEGWKKYRYHETYLPDAQDKISHCFFSLIGLGANDLRQESDLNWCKMLSYIGLITGRSRSQEVINAVVSHYFSVQTSIQEWVLRYVDIAPEQQTQIGFQNYQLGATTLLGSQIKDRSSKFIITIHDLDVSRFMDFLPFGKEHQVLKKVIQFMLRTQMVYDLDLEIKANEVESLNLSDDTGSYLGWTSFLGKTDISRNVHIQMET